MNNKEACCRIATPSRLLRCGALGVAKQCLETKIHVLLDVTVKQREARLVGDEVHCDASKCGNDHRILHNAASRLAVELHKLE